MEVHAEPLLTVEADVPQRLLNGLSLACRWVECLERAYVGWVRQSDDRRPDTDARVELEMYLWYGQRLPRPRPIPPGNEAEAIFIDTPDLADAGLPEMAMSCDHGVAPNAKVAQRWLRVY